MQNTIVNVNGEIVEPNDAKVSIFDRGYIYGDSLYEVTRSYQGKFFKLEEHLERMEKSAALCRMSLGQSTEEYQEEIQKTFAAFRKQAGNQNKDVYMRIMVSRGIGRIGFGLECVTTPTQFVIVIQDVAGFTASMTPERFEKGLHLHFAKRIRNDRRALDPAMKSGNYLNSLLAYLEAVDQGPFEDAILCNFDGHVTEGTTFNVGYVNRGIVAIPPLDIGILDGITRRIMIEVAQDLGIEVREVRFTPQRMLEADETFVTSSLKEIYPITQLDGKKIGSGKPGAITRKMAQAYRDYVERYTDG